MKTRSGFVSNSSSSSFVVLGCLLEKNLVPESFFEEELFVGACGSDCSFDGKPGTVLLGKKLFCIDSNTMSLEGKTLSLSDLSKIADELKEDLKKRGLDNLQLQLVPVDSSC